MKTHQIPLVKDSVQILILDPLDSFDENKEAFVGDTLEGQNSDADKTCRAQ